MSSRGLIARLCSPTWRLRCWQIDKAQRLGMPSNTNQNKGATSESLRFSAKVSSAVSLTWASLSWLTSRLHKSAKRSRPAASDWFNAASTACTSCTNMRQANKGLSVTASKAMAAQEGNSAASCCTPTANSTHTKAPKHQNHIPRANSLPCALAELCATSGAQRVPVNDKYWPIHTTGCQRALGSPHSASMAKATSRALDKIMPS